MPSEVWGRDPQEAYEEPYEYGIQDQFSREARTLFKRLYKTLNSDRHRYTAEDRSCEKAVWLLAMDALDSLRECLEALGRKEHRVAGKLFRDVVESMDLATYLRSGTNKSKRALARWYSDKIIGHNEYREHVRKTQSLTVSKLLAKHYSSLSRFTHRSYRAILDGYSRAAENRLVHDRSGELFGTKSQAITQSWQTSQPSIWMNYRS